MTHWRAIGFASACLYLLPTAAVAQVPTTEARAAFQAGVAQYGLHHYAEALESFRTAYRVRPHPSVLVNIANCELALNRPEQALATFDRYLTDAAATLSPEQRAAIETAMADARQRLATLDVVVRPVGAEVYLDGDLVGTAPLRHRIETGSGLHVLEARMAGMPSQQYQARVEGGGRLTVTLDLVTGRALAGSEPTSAEPTVSPLMVVVTPPVAAVEATPPTPVQTHPPVLTPVPLPVGASTGTATSGGPRHVRVHPPVEPLPQPSPHPEESAHGGGIPTVTWVSGILTLGLAGLAIGSEVYAAQQDSDFNTAAGQYAAISAQLQQAARHQIYLTPAQVAQDNSNLLLLHQQGNALNGTYETYHTLGWIAGGLAIAGGVFTVASYFLFRTPEDQPTGSATGLQGINVMPTPDGHGFLLGGAF